MIEKFLTEGCQLSIGYGAELFVCVDFIDNQRHKTSVITSKGINKALEILEARLSGISDKEIEKIENSAYTNTVFINDPIDFLISKKTLICVLFEDEGFCAKAFQLFPPTLKMGAGIYEASAVGKDIPLVLKNLCEADFKPSNLIPCKEQLY